MLDFLVNFAIIDRNVPFLNVGRITTFRDRKKISHWHITFSLLGDSLLVNPFENGILQKQISCGLSLREGIAVISIPLFRKQQTAEIGFTMPLPSDEELCVCIRQGDSRAEEVLVDRYRHKVEMRLKHTYPHIDYEQAANDSCWKAIKYARAEIVTSFAGLVYLIANQIGWRASQRIRPEELKVVQIDILTNIPDATPTPETKVLQAEASELLYKAIDKCLTSYERKVILLYYVNTRSLPEIAAQCGKSTNAVKQTLHHSRQKLKRYLRQNESGSEA
jgi:RNA polymerase sigma factor (sigma-70 family)